MTPMTEFWPPGPWTVLTGVCRNDHPDTSADVLGADGEVVADCGCHEAAIANAHLIAAAPQLLDALIKLTNEAAGFLAMADPDTHGHTNRAVLRERIRLAQDAISKALGDPPSLDAVDPPAGIRERRPRASKNNRSNR